MSNRFYDNEFEKYLKDQTDQHRMYPSDHVWRNIQHEVHGYKKWPALTFISIFIISALVVSTVVLKPHTQLTASPLNTVKSNNAAPVRQDASRQTENEKGFNGGHLLAENITQQTIADVIRTVQSNQVEERLVLPAPKELSASETVGNAPDEKPATGMVSTSDEIKQPDAVAVHKHPEKPVFSPSLLLRDDLDFKSPEFANNHSNSFHFLFASSSGDLYNEELSDRFSFGINNGNNNPSSILKLNGDFSRFDFQFYAGPSISYRRLVDDVHGALAQSYISALPFNANYMVDVNKIIQHKSAAGYEVGFGIGYNVTHNFAVRSGLQFNLRQYNIDAYIHASEPAAISYGSNGVWNTISGFRNIAGSLPIVLKNRYYEISLPVGVDWRPINRKFAWGIAASVQPTYTFDKEPFIISSNLKNYADGSQLMRNWNINTSFETYLGYNTGNYRWQIGPQIRYQLMPTMNNSYPIREYLLDYGVKIGLIKSLK